MLRKFLIVFIFSFNNPLIAQQNVISWSSKEGIERLSSSKHKIDFFKLANNFDSQTNKIFCGPTSTAIVLNALRVRQTTFNLPQDKTLLKAQDLIYLPKKNGWSPFYKRYTQNNVLYKSPKSRAVILGKPLIKKEDKFLQDFGLQLHQLSELLIAHNLEVNTYVVTDNAHSSYLKQIMINNLKTAGDYVIVNYLRTSLNQLGGGHISPLGAYHSSSDSFLILDTVPNKDDWVWVKADTLIRAMRTFDTIENRGFVLIKEPLINEVQRTKE